MPADLETESCLRQREVYFDFDKSEIKPQFEEIIACHAKYLQDRPRRACAWPAMPTSAVRASTTSASASVVANAVAAALEADGASADQITVVSYGEEHPVCREHNEACWSKNRRVEIQYTAK